ncbi:MBL fold metallo-hydrolase RNA specificity domain-containing protein [Methylomarinum roseum]|uniref:MBL fold metallo-hydrolase RNA specificity domain-containing protein n=1 Tax=Methylomarinum roseum TaxID=3067653 RepID=UPI003D7CFABD
MLLFRPCRPIRSDPVYRWHAGIKPREIRLVHGDERAKLSLQKQLRAQFAGIKIHMCDGSSLA